MLIFELEFIDVWPSHSRESWHPVPGNFDAPSRFPVQGIHGDVKDCHDEFHDGWVLTSVD